MTERVIVRFGDFELDSAARTLRRQGELVPIQEKPFQALLTLVTRAGEVVSREDLVRALWGSDYVDGEQGLNTAVHKLREALGDDAQHPRLVATVARRGYRFVASVEFSPRPSQATIALRPEPSPRAEPALRAEAGTSTRRDRRGGRLLVTLVAILLFGGLAVTVTLVWRTATREAPRAAGAGSVRSIAVLPLADLSPAASETYLAVGVTDLLITELASSTNLRVTSHASAAAVERRGRPLPDLARELGVDAIVEGAVVRSGDQLRITAQLIDARRDVHLWAGSFDGTIADLLAFERRVARAICREVGAVTATTTATVRPLPTAAFESYMRGRELFYLGINRPYPSRREALLAATEQYTRALSVAPDWAAPLAARAAAAHWMGELDPARLFSAAREDAVRAIALDDSLAEAHGALGYVSAAYFRDYALAERELLRAIELDPSTPYRHGLGMLLSRLGRFAAASEQFRLAEERDPLAVVLRWNAAWHELCARHFDAALQRFRALEGESPGAQIGVALALAFAGRPTEAITELRDAKTPSGSWARQALVCALALAGQGAEARREAMQLSHEAEGTEPLSVARAYACLGDADRAMPLLERAFAENGVWLLDINVNPAFDRLRRDQRFVRLLARLGVGPAVEGTGLRDAR